MRKTQNWMAVFCAAVFLLLGGISDAFAHAQLLSSDPADGAVLAEAPRSVTLRFSEPVKPLVTRLVHPGGRTEILHDASETGASVTIGLPGKLESGTHILSWRVTSSDGHPIGGGLIFSVGAPSAIAPSAVETADPAVLAGLWIARFLVMAGLVFGVGGTAFNSLVVRDVRVRRGRLVGATLVVGLLAVPLLVGFQGIDALGETPSALLRYDVWAAGLWATSYGRSALFAALALLVAFASRQAGAGTRLNRILSVVALLLVGVVVAGAGHASTAPPRFLTVPAIFLHAVAAAFWLGALVPLAGLMRGNAPEMPDALRRFSVSIPFIVAVLLASGLLLAVVQLGSVAALWQTGYGLVLLAKLALVAGMLLLAAFNRMVLTRPAMRGEGLAVKRLKNSITVEVILGCAILAVLGLWRFTPPPRALALAPPAVQEIVAKRDGLEATLSIHPPAVGAVFVEVTNVRLDGKPLEPLSISIDLDKPSYGIGPFTHEARPVAPQIYRADGFVLPMDGFWVVRATVLVSDFRSVTLTDIFDVGTSGR